MTQNNQPHQQKKYDGFIRFSVATDTILKKLQKYKNNQLSEFGLRSMHLMFLYCLAKSDDGMTPGELAQSCSVDKAFISRISHELRSFGYISYSSAKNSENMRYKRRLTLTEKGHQIMMDVNSKVANAADIISAGITEDQLETFYAVLSAMEKNMCELAGE